MDSFEYRQGQLYAEDVALGVIAERHGTPCYVYSRAAFTNNWKAFDQALQPVPHLVCYAVKANSSLAVLQVLAQLGSGFDIVSGGELARVLRAGGDAGKVVFSGIGKTVQEMRAALQAGICCFNVESESELHKLNRVALELGVRAPAALRVNPDVDAKTHPYISTGLKNNKFGVDIPTAERLYLESASLPGIEIVGVASHIGSQLLEVQPFMDALERVLALVGRLAVQGVKLRHIDVGGGLGVRYNQERTLPPSEWAQALLPRLQATGLKVLTEPGRAIAASAGVLLTKVETLKLGEAKNFAVVDAAMNDLLRPTLYQAWMNIVCTQQQTSASVRCYDVVGPVCESGDWIGRDRELALAEGDLLAVLAAGAYGFVMSSNYNTRGRAAEVLVDGAQLHLARERESFDDVIRAERLLP